MLNMTLNLNVHGRNPFSAILGVLKIIFGYHVK